MNEGGRKAKEVSLQIMKERKKKQRSFMQRNDNVASHNIQKMDSSIEMKEEKGELTARLEEAVSRAAKRMGVEIEKSNQIRLNEYALELQRWNKAYNLVGRRIGTDGLVSLFVDAISPLCIKGLLEEDKEILDIGSGAGLPGMALYLAAGPFPLTLVESQRKKVTFLRHIRRKFGMKDVDIYPGRLEEMVKEEDLLSAYDLGFSRAVMDPFRLVKLAKPLISEGGRLVVFVGKKDAEKLKRSKFSLEEKGLKLEAIRSTQRIVGKENFLAVVGIKQN
jgi:16S rRNA (guanine527-N7)-methyltransferase